MQYNIKNLVKTIAGQKNTANTVFNHANTEQEFMTLLSQKSYYENYSLLYYSAIFFALVSQFATAISSYTFFADLLAIKLSPTLLPFAVAILLLLIEVLKYVSFNKGLEGVFALPQRINYVLLVFAILLSAGSMYASIIGGGSFGIDTQRIASTETKYDGEIATLRSEIAEIHKRNTWKGSTYLPKKEKKLLYSKEEELTQLKQQKEQHLADVATDNETAATQYQFGFAFFDALFLLCTLYVWYFRKNVAVEGMVNESQKSSPPPPAGGVMQVIQPVITQPVMQAVAQVPTTQQPITPAVAQVPTQPVSTAGTIPKPPHRRKDYLRFTPMITEEIKKKDDENRINENRQENEVLVEVSDDNRINENRQEILGVRKCLNIANCNNDFVANHKKQKFCCDACRQMNWEQKTKRALIFKKKSAGKPEKVQLDLFA